MEQFKYMLRQVKGERDERTLPPPPIMTQTPVYMTVKAFSGGGVGDLMGEENTVVTEELVVQGLQIFMP